MEKLYAIVGLGSRSHLYLDAIINTYPENNRLVALCDNNQGRMDLVNQEFGSKIGLLPTYAHTDFERMIAETRPDTVIVTSKDATHDGYICRAMELGCDVLTEKPMTIDEHKCRRILDTQQATGKKVTVTFNYRYAPPRTQVKDLLMSGVIGEVLSVDFHWLLDTTHGADYFRRWHRHKENSGGLMVHKATHHFDLVNWWLSTVPETVYATGRRNFYRPQTAERYGLTRRGDRCYGCAEAKRCPFFLDLSAYPDLKNLYLETEQFDGYRRDQCVFSPDMDIEDTMNVAVNYRSGATMSYSLNAFMPWEGYIVSFNGSKGRLEHICKEQVYVNGDGSIPGELIPEGTQTRVLPHFQAGYEVEVWQSEGGHGGADPVMLHDLFAPEGPADQYKRAADHRAGAWSILTGIAANHAIRSGQPVRLADLIDLPALPDYPAMPQPTEPIDVSRFNQSAARRVTLI